MRVIAASSDPDTSKKQKIPTDFFAAGLRRSVRFGYLSIHLMQVNKLQERQQYAKYIAISIIVARCRFLLAPLTFEVLLAIHLKICRVDITL